MKAPMIVIGIACVILAGSLLGCGPQYAYYGQGYRGHHDGYQSSPYQAREAYDAGYQRGYEHGSADRRGRLSFDFDHDEVFRRGVSNDRYVNEQFRSGYARGYGDGYYGGRKY